MDNRSNDKIYLIFGKQLALAWEILKVLMLSQRRTYRKVIVEQRLEIVAFNKIEFSILVDVLAEHLVLSMHLHKLGKVESAAVYI